MIERAYFSMGGAAVSLLGRTLAFKGFGIGLFQSESGGWEVDGVRLPWCGIRAHRGAGLRGLKLFAGDWLLWLHALADEDGGEG